MRAISSLLTLLIATILACGPAAAQEWKPKVDPSQVTSYEAYTALDGDSYARYQTRENASYKQHVNTDTHFFNEYRKLRMVLLKELRSIDKVNYLEWLDAREIEDSEKERRLLTSVPALAEYERKRSDANKSYETQKNTSYANYITKKQEAYKIHREEKRLLWEAYEALPK